MGTALDRHLVLVGFMGAGKTTIGQAVAERLGRRFVDLDREIERAEGLPVAGLFATRGEAAFRVLERRRALDALRDAAPAVLSFGGGALGSEQIRDALRERAVAVLLEVEPDEAWRRVGGTDRPLAQDEEAFRQLYEERRDVYETAADARARDIEGVVLAAGGVHVESGALGWLGGLVAGDGPVALVADRHVAGIYGMEAQLGLGARQVATHEVPSGEEAKTLHVVELLWRALRLERGGTVVALGGGCTTDVAGFAAATYLRGVD